MVSSLKVQTCTTLLAKELINNDNPLVIANSDQFVEWNANEVMYAFSTEGIDGGILTFQSTHLNGLMQKRMIVVL